MLITSVIPSNMFTEWLLLRCLFTMQFPAILWVTVTLLYYYLFCLSGFSFTSTHFSQERRGSGEAISNSSLPLLAGWLLQRAHLFKQLVIGLDLRTIVATKQLPSIANSCSVYNFTEKLKVLGSDCLHKLWFSA